MVRLDHVAACTKMVTNIICVLCPVVYESPLLVQNKCDHFAIKTPCKTNVSGLRLLIAKRGKKNVRTTIKRLYNAIAPLKSANGEPYGTDSCKLSHYESANQASLPVVLFPLTEKSWHGPMHSVIL